MSTLVIGATGRQGGGCARALLKAGVRVHALVRNPGSEAAKQIQSQGAILFQGDINDSSAVSKAIEGVTGVFFNPPFPETVQNLQTFIQTCAAQPSVKIFVLSSSSGVEQHENMVKKDATYTTRHQKFAPYFSIKAGTEAAAKEAGFENLVIVRAPMLYHNYLPPDPYGLFPALWTERRVVTALKPETKVPHALAEDVGRFAALALLDPGKFKGEEIDLVSENLTSIDVARTIREVTGTEVEVVTPNFDGIEAVGVNSPIAPYQAWCNEIDAAVDTSVSKRYGMNMTTLREVLEQHKDEMIEAMRG